GGAAIAVQLTFLLLTFPEWYVINICGVLISAGAAAIFGISFGLLPALLLLVGLALYDAWAVYSTGHMVDLADTVMELKLPILLVMPKQRGYSFLKQRSLQAQIETGEEREAMFMGLGDIVIPGVLSVSAKASLGWGVGLGTMFGGLAGFAILMHFVLGGRPQAGLPLLNGGAILGWAFTAILLTGSLGL
ncbi:MAG: presenilin family intramembrane aspartyl protease PSH, partial [Candidatus Poseidoniia archaeon]|nr:presenilin family intramembrane aspartyl protease PSH [Candidatus Poseidoniia archaeon]MDP6834963.1 presenilin family intramembrane aspartyl protease PSH [Candidatus Poseidoniia archaeon]